MRHSVILCTLYSGSRVHTEYTHIFNMECCSVTSCKKSPNLHRFPNDVHIRRQWTVFCCRASSWIPGPGDRICQLHFSSHDIKSDGRLKEEAVPHIKGIFKTYWIFASPFRMFCSGVDNFSPFTISNWKFIKHFLSPISQYWKIYNITIFKSQCKQRLTKYCQIYFRHQNVLRHMTVSLC